MAKGQDITTNFKVDISDLKKGISEANRQIKLANAEFKAATGGAKDWASSIEGVQAKITQMTRVLEVQKTKLDNYKRQLSDLKGIYSESAKNVDKLTQEYEKAKQQYGENSNEAKEYAKALDKAKEELDRNRVAVDNMTITMRNQEGEVESVRRELTNYSNTLGSLENNLEDAEDGAEDLGDELGNTGNAAENASGGFTVLKGALANLVADGFRKAIDAAKEFAKSMIDTAAEVKAENSQFAQTFGDMGGEAEAAIKRVANSTGILDTRLRTTGANIYAFARSNGATIPEAMDLMETALMASADSAAYYDKSLEESSETMMSFLKGNYANDAALGVSATEFTRNAKATELFGQKYNDLTEIQKQQTLLKMVTDSQALSGAMGQAAREMDGWENVQGNFNETWRQFKALVGTPFLEALIPVVQGVTTAFREWSENVDWDAFNVKIKEISDKIIQGFGWVVENKDILIAAISGIIAAFVAAKIATFVSTLMGVAKAIQAAAAAQGIWNGVILANPIGAIAVAVGLLVAAIVLLIQHWDDVKNAAVACWNKIKEIWGAVADWFNTTIIEPIKNFFTGLWDTVTQKFTEAKNAVINIWNTVSDWFNTNVIQPIQKFFSDMGTAISGFFTTAWNTIKTVWTTVSTWFDTNVIQPIKNFFQPLVDWFTQLFTSIKDFITSVFEVVAQLAEGCVIAIQRVWEVLGEWFNVNVIEPIKQFFTELWETIQNAAQATWDFIVSVWEVVSGWFNDNIINPIKNFFSDMWNAITEAATNAWNAIKNVWNVVSNWFDSTIVKPITNFFSGMWDKVKTGAKNAFEGVKSAFSSIPTWFKDVFTKAWTNVKNVFSTGGKIFDGIKDGILNGLKAVVNAIIKGMNKVIKTPFDGINSALRKIRDIEFLGISPFKNVISEINVPQIPELATGGILKRGQVGLLEGNGAEAVVPLERNKYWIAKVVEELKKQLNISDLISSLRTNLNGMVNGLATENSSALNNSINNARNNVNNFTQIINAPKQPSRIELYRQTKNLLEFKKGGV